MSLPKVSVVIPSYNHEKYVKEAIESVLNQTFQDFELIITDDGSTDRTVDKIKEFDDERIQLYVFEENQGAPNAMNHCIKKAKGEYIAYVSSDDVWELDKLEKQVEFLDNNKDISVVFSRASIIGEDSKILTGDDSSNNSYEIYKTIFNQANRSREEWLRRFFFEGNCICHPSILIRREVYDDVGFYDERLANLPDFDMWVRVCFNHEIYILNEELVRFRIRDDDSNMSSPTFKAIKRHKFEQKQILNHYLSINDVSLFLKVFPSSKKYGKFIKELIPYFLGRIACEMNNDLYSLWGLELIYGLMKSDKTNLILKDYGFEFSDFINMTASEDVFHIEDLNEYTQALSQIHVLNNEINKINDIAEERYQNIIEKDKQLFGLTIALEENHRNLEENHRNLEKKNRDIKKKNKELKTRKNQLKSKNKQLKNSNLRIKEMQSSISWKITKPIRKIGNLLRKIKNYPYFYIFLKSNIHFKELFRNLKAYNILKNSSLFNTKYYYKKYPSIKKSNTNPIIHYMYYGFKEGKNPSQKFDTNFYLSKYKKVKNSKMNPLVHYILYGKNEKKYSKFEEEVENFKIAEKNLKNLDLIEFPEDSPLISIIILTLNGIDNLKRLFKNFEENICYPNYEIIVVDNGSTDESIKFLNSLTLPITIIENEKNESFSKANNEASKIAKGDFLLFLNNDIETTYGWLNEMFQTSSRYNHEVSVGAKLVYPSKINDEGQFVKPSLQHRGIEFSESELEGIHPENVKGKIFSKSASLEYEKVAMTAACLLIKKSIFEEIGRFDEKYFYGYEDVDLGLKMISQGYKNIYCPNSLLFHHEALTTKKRWHSNSQNYRIRSNNAYLRYKWEDSLLKKIITDKLNKTKIFSEDPLNIIFLVENKNVEKKISKIIKDINKYGWIAKVKVMNKINIYEINYDVDVLISTVANYYPKEIRNAKEHIVKIALTLDNQNIWLENLFIKDYDFFLSNQKDFFKGEVPFCISSLNSKQIIENVKMAFKYKNFKNIYEEIENNDYIVDTELKMQHIYSNEDFHQNYMKIGVFTDSGLKNPAPSYCLRIFHILNKIVKNKKYKFFIYSGDDYLDENFFNYKCFDIVVIQRNGTINSDILKIIIDKCKEYDIKIIQEFDDDLLALPETHPDYINHLSKHEGLKLMAKESDMLVVSTDELKNRYLNHNDNIEVVKNYLNPLLSNSDEKLDYEKIVIEKRSLNEPKKRNLIKLGYFGTPTHKNDFLLIKDSIKNVVNKVKEKGIDLQLDIIGVFDSYELTEDWINIFEEYIPYKSFFKSFRSFNWNVGIAPLVDDEFNATKSELKYIEYTSLGIPSVCSDVKPYNSAIQDGFNGFLAKTPEEWEEKLEKLVLDESLRDEIVKNAVDNINKNYLIDSRVQQWEEILGKLI